MNGFVCYECGYYFDTPNHKLGCPEGFYRYTAKSGVVVTSPYMPEDDFKTVFHYLRFSYGAWGFKIYKAVKLDWIEKLQARGILKPS